MSSLYPRLVLLLLAALLLSSLADAAAQQPAERKRPAKPQPAAPDPQPVLPPPPPTLAQMPATPPYVSFRNGQLTIIAQNSTLGDILRAVRAQTGAAVEIPGNANERVVTQLGPGPARDVLASLLNGSHFNYVMLGSASNPAMVERIILTSKAGEESDASQPGHNASGRATLAQGGGAIAGEQDQEDAPVDDNSQEMGEVDQPDDSATAGEEQPQSNGQPAVRTPEQLLRELQQQQQQQQQQGAPQRFPTPQPQPAPPPN